MHNLYEQLRQLIPDPPLQAGTVVGVDSGIATVALPGGGLIRARGSVPIGQEVFVRDDVIEGVAPSLMLEITGTRNPALRSTPEPAYEAGFIFLETAMAEPEHQQPALIENMLPLRYEGSDELPDRAAECGVERCFAHIGLENGSVTKDIRELRDLLEAQCDVRRTTWQTAIEAVTAGILATLLAGAAIKLRLMGDV